jgi:hypothetical protein
MNSPTFALIWDKLNNEQRKYISSCSKPNDSNTRFVHGINIRLNTWNRMLMGSEDEKIWSLIPIEFRKKGNT